MTRPSSASCLVIGSGPAGLVTALELTRLGIHDVLIVERGEFLGFEHISRRTLKPTYRFSDDSWTATTAHFRQRPGIDGPVGGRSLCWEGIIMPINEATLRSQWPMDAFQMLSGSGPASYQEVQRTLESWKGRPLSAPASHSDQLIAEALVQLKLPVPFDVVPNAAFNRLHGGARRWQVYSPLQAWSPRGLPPYSEEVPRIVTGLRAKRLLTQGSEICGAAFETPEGDTVEIHSDTVVLACGVLETTRLYAQALDAIGDQFFEVWPNLHDHIVHGVLLPLPTALASSWKRGDRVFLYSDLTNLYGGNLFFEVHADRLPFPILDLWWIARPEEPVSGSIRFERSGEVWPGCVSAQLTVRDRSAIARRLAFTEDLLATLGVQPRRMIGRATGYRRALTSAVADHAARFYVNRLGSTEHESGTLPWGSHTQRGGRASWSERLFVAGASVFPASAAANPTLTIIALAQGTALEVASALGRARA
jgi:choline dehydrogenase-like flavoprotein